MRALLYQRPIHKALATHIWVATHGLRNDGLSTGYRPPRDWPMDQNAEYGKYHVFSTFETFFFLHWNGLKVILSIL